MGNSTWREVDGLKVEFEGRTGSMTVGGLKGDGEKTKGLDRGGERR